MSVSYDVQGCERCTRITFTHRVAQTGLLEAPSLIDSLLAKDPCQRTCTISVDSELTKGLALKGEQEL